MIPVKIPQRRSLRTPVPKTELPTDYSPKNKGNLIVCDVDSFAMLGIEPQVNPLQPSSLLTLTTASGILLYFCTGMTQSWITLTFMFSIGIWTKLSKKPAQNPAIALLAIVSFSNLFMTASKTPNHT